ncbi:MAG: lytic transglycosylase domain-containing protein [Dehalococcoidia bacterium]
MSGRARRVTTLFVAAAGLLGVALVVALTLGRGDEPPARAGEGPGPAVLTPTATIETVTVTATATPVMTAQAGPPPSLTEAARLLREGDFEASVRAFQAVSAQAAGVERAAALTGEANARLELGDREAALAALRSAVDAAPLPSLEGVRARYLLGRALNESKAFVEARTVLEPAKGMEPLAAYVAYEAGKAAIGAGDRESAAAAFELAARPDVSISLRTTALRALADLAPNPAAKVAGLERERAVRETSGLLTLLATARAEAGDARGAEAVLRLLIARYPASVGALEAVRKLGVAGMAVDAGEAGLVYYRHGQLADARKALEAGVTESGVADDVMGWRWYYLGATYEDLGLAKEAVAAYDRAASLADAAFRHRARYWAARVTEGMDDARGASARYRGVVSGGAGEFAAESAFRAGFVLLDGGDAEGAIAAWSETGTTGGARALYWKGRAFATLGRTAEARAAWESARAAEPGGLYALESARELGLGGLPAVTYRPLPVDTGVDWVAVERWLTSAAGARAAETDTSVAQELVAAGLHDEAQTVLLELGTTPWAMFDAMRAARELGLPAAGVLLAFRLGGRYADPDGVLARLEYPLAFTSTLDAEARVRGIDPLFLAALIRQESLWDEKAGSTAGALGLTQVIPPTGEAIARELGVTGFKAEDLFRPSVALRFGAYYIAGQIARFGSPWAGLAAYNAGPGPAARWGAAAGGKTAAEYIEAVDYSETHGYVALVLDHYARYVAAYR